MMELPELHELKVVREEDSSNDKIEEQEIMCGPESDVNHRSNDSKIANKTREHHKLEPLRNVMQNEQDTRIKTLKIKTITKVMETRRTV